MQLTPAAQQQPQNARMDYIESFLSSKFGAQYEPFATFKAREK